MGAVVKVHILYRKDKPDDITKAEAMKKLIMNAGKIINKQVEVELSTNFRQFENISVNLAMTPICIMDGISEFAGNVPSIDVIKQKLIQSGSASDSF